MERKSKFTPEQKIQAVRDYLDGKKGETNLSNCTMLCKTHNRAKGNR